ncbi:MAG: hypothetical protein GC134_03215 [Proteobacteria bacterium]|nr:hypothetical protein [Pseudomonadota bacterium]
MFKKLTSLLARDAGRGTEPSSVLNADDIRLAYATDGQAGAYKADSTDVRDAVRQDLRQKAEAAQEQAAFNPVLERSESLSLALGIAQMADKQVEYTFYEPKPGFGINTITPAGGRTGYNPFGRDTDLEVVPTFGRSALVHVPMHQSDYNQMDRKSFLSMARKAAQEQGFGDMSDKDLFNRVNIAQEPGYINHPATGLQAVAVVEKESGQLIFGVPGMNGEKVEAVEAAIHLGKNQADVLYQEVLPVVKSAEHRDRQVVLAGHSLGGSVVQHVGYHLANPTQSTARLDVQIYNFEGPAISTALKDYDPERVSPDRITNIAVEGSQVAKWGTRFGGSHLGGEVHYLKSSFGTGLKTMMRNHQMDSVADALAYHVHTGEEPQLVKEANHQAAVDAKRRAQEQERTPDMTHGFELAL